MTAAVVLLSGGLDSGAALAMWLADDEAEVARCLTFDYGQLSAAAECRAAAALARRFDLPWQRIELPFLGAAAATAGSALVGSGGGLPTPAPDPETAALGDADSAAAVWVPARNVVFLAIAAAVAEASGAAVVLAGFNREEARTFPDNSAPFVAAFDAVLRLGTRSGVTVCSPTLDLDKRAIARRARLHGLSATDFYSCYGPGPTPCGRCESCARSRHAWALAD